jgi:signal recognition particle subunit SRP54
LVSVAASPPTTRHQLSLLAKNVTTPIYEGTPEETKPLELARSARREAVQAGRDILLVDTAGRQHIDDQLMQELRELKEALNPSEILFVADAMTGQDAVRSAEEFHKQLGITGVVLTKMDGDARGGAALSIRSITGQPLKFVGVGEKTDALEAFFPDRIASRILGMGDVLSLIDKVEQAIDQKTAEKMQEKLLGDDFSLEDFRDQIKQIRKLGPLSGLLEMMPQIGPLKELKNAKIDESEVGRIVAIIDSMTPKERRNYMIINGSRRRRIAKGSGATVQDVNNLLKQYAQARKMMKSFTGQAGMLGKRLGKMKLPGFPGF